MTDHRLVLGGRAVEPVRFRHGEHMLGGHGPGAFFGRHPQGLQGDVVHLAGNPAGESEHLEAGVGRKQFGRVAAGDRDPMMEVLDGLVGAQDLHPVAGLDAVIERLELGTGQDRLELGVAHQDDAQQALALHLQQRKTLERAEEFVVEDLGAVDDQDGQVAARVHRGQQGSKVGGRQGLPGGVDAEAQADLLEQLVGGEVRLRHECHHGARAPLAQRVVDRQGPARAGVAGDQDERFPMLEAVAQMDERVPVSPAREQVFGMVTGEERVLAQAELCLEHGSPSHCRAPQTYPGAPRWVIGGRGGELYRLRKGLAGRADGAAGQPDMPAATSWEVAAGGAFERLSRARRGAALRSRIEG